jgi:hypothetical protein
VAPARFQGVAHTALGVHTHAARRALAGLRRRSRRGRPRSRLSGPVTRRRGRPLSHAKERAGAGSAYARSGRGPSGHSLTAAPALLRSREPRRGALLVIARRRSERSPRGLVRSSTPVAGYDAFSSAAERTRALKASSSVPSPSWKSIARLMLPSRLELKRPAGSSNEAPLKKVSFTLSL